MHQVKKILLFLCLYAVVVCGSCSHKTKESVFATVSDASPTAKMSTVFDAEQSASLKEGVFGNDTQTDVETLANKSTDRKLVYRADVGIEVKSLVDAESSISDWCFSSGGYIARAEIDATSLFITVRIPADSFDKALTRLDTLGKIKRRSVSTEDITEAYYDVRTRLDTRYVLQDRLQEYLKTAKNMTDLLTIERELNLAQGEIERMEGQLQRLTNQVDFSTVDISVYLPYNTAENGFIFPDIKNGFKRFLENTINFFWGLLLVIFYIIVFGIPLVLFVALVYFLCFGKIGLIRRLFKRLRGNKN